MIKQGNIVPFSYRKVLLDRK